jgi:hypothetical protein
MRDKPGGSVFRANAQRRRAIARINPAMWRATHEIAARRRLAIWDLVNDISRDIPGVALRLYVAGLYRTDVTQLKDSEANTAMPEPPATTPSSRHRRGGSNQ